jgi:hypothetical protein
MSGQSPWNAGGFGLPPQLPPQAYPSGHYRAAPPPPAYAPYPPPVGGPPRRRRGPVLIIAGVATAAVITGLLIWTPWNSASGTPGDAASPSTLASSQDPTRIAEASLREAAEALDSAQAVSYEGGFTDSDGKSADFALQTTHAARRPPQRHQRRRPPGHRHDARPGAGRPRPVRPTGAGVAGWVQRGRRGHPAVAGGPRRYAYGVSGRP